MRGRACEGVHACACMCVHGCWVKLVGHNGCLDSGIPTKSSIAGICTCGARTEIPPFISQAIFVNWGSTILAESPGYHQQKAVCPATLCLSACLCVSASVRRAEGDANMRSMWGFVRSPPYLQRPPSGTHPKLAVLTTVSCFLKGPRKSRGRCGPISPRSCGDCSVQEETEGGRAIDCGPQGYANACISWLIESFQISGGLLACVMCVSVYVCFNTSASALIVSTVLVLVSLTKCVCVCVCVIF